MNLRHVFALAKNRTLLNQELWLPRELEWTLDTTCVFIDWEHEDKDSSDIPLIAKRLNLIETLDNGMLEDVVTWADRLSNSNDPAAR